MFRKNCSAQQPYFIIIMQCAHTDTCKLCKFTDLIHEYLLSCLRKLSIYYYAASVSRGFEKNFLSFSAVFAALHGIVTGKLFVNLVHDHKLFKAPQRSYQRVPCAVARNTLDNKLRGQKLQLGADDIHIFLQRQGGKLPSQVFLRHGSVPDDMQQVELYAVKLQL